MLLMKKAAKDKRYGQVKHENMNDQESVISGQDSSSLHRGYAATYPLGNETRPLPRNPPSSTQPNENSVPNSSRPTRCYCC